MELRGGIESNGYRQGPGPEQRISQLRSVCGLPSVRRKGLSDSREVFCPVREWFTTNWGRQERFLLKNQGGNYEKVILVLIIYPHNLLPQF